ncbi:hypothetical protein K443DRAFT_15817 [Laccaria amethystina LaAM-08-1]|uniref:Uncharacterized protein n=1 Tax=Laccaria amethystina LaAM-08-1 TaxID=1095629 RepID=A0A0C9WZC5_9AGAR|nr:hypothetical protein K443DRAFT_15817 [Laccaria amethystina LaAM-08-1]
MARVSGVPLNGGRARCEVENREPEGFTKHLRNWPTLCFKFQKAFNAIKLQTQSQEAVSGGQRLLEYIRKYIVTGLCSKILCNLLVAASHLSFIVESHFHPDTLPDLPDFINDERINASHTAKERDFLRNLRELIQDNDLRPEECSSGLSLASFRAALQLAVNISPLYLLTPYIIAKRQWNRQTIYQVGAHIGNGKPTPLVEVENVIWRAIFSMSTGKMSPPEAVTFIKDNIEWARLKAQCSEGLPDALDFFKIKSKASEAEMSRDAVDALTSQHLLEKRGNLNSNAPMGKDKNISGIGAACQSGMAQQHSDPAPMEGVDGTGTISQGGMPCGSNMVENPDNPTSVVDKSTDPTPMDEDEAANGIGANPQGGMPCGSASIPEAQDLDENLGSLDPDTPMDEVEDDNKAGAEYLDEDQRADGDQGLDEGSDEDSDEDSDEGSGKDQPASRDESRSMVVDGSGSVVDKIERRRQSSRLQECSNRLSDTDGIKQKSQRESKAPPRSQNPRKRKPELEKPSGNLDNFGTQSNPIDVDFLERGSLWDPDGLDTYRLNRERIIPRCSAIEIPGTRAQCKGDFYAFTASGEKVRLEPKFHYESYAIRFSQLMQNVQKQYDNDVPPHCQKDGHSVIQTMTWDEYNQTKPEELHKILQTKNIVVSGHLKPIAAPTLKFDGDGLEEIFSIHDTISLQDYSLYDDGSDEDDKDGGLLLDELDKMTTHVPKTVSGTLRDVLESSETERVLFLRQDGIPLHQIKQLL